MDRDLRETPLWAEVEALYRRVLEPGFGRITGIEDPRTSPDATTISFTGRRLDDLEGDPRGRICTVGVDGTGLRQLTDGPREDAGARWSPDGSRLTFRSDRDHAGRMQLFAIDPRSGQIEPLPEVPDSVEDHAWSPDGSRVLAVVAGAGADKAAASGSGSVEEGDELPAWMPDVEASDGSSEWRRLFLVDLGTGEVRRLSAEGRNVWEAAWCGNDAVAAIVSDDPGEQAWYTAPLALIDVATGAERELLRSELQLGWAVGSPDGRRVAVIEALCSDRLIVAGDLLLVDVSSGAATRVDAGEVDVSRMTWRANDRLFTMGIRGMDTVAAQVEADGAAWTELWTSASASGDWYPIGTPIGNGDVFASVLHSSRRPPALVAVERGGERVLASTAHDGTEVLAGFVSRRRRVSWTADDGLAIEGLVTLPSGDGPHPLVVWVHGGPVWAYADAWPRVSMALLVARGYAIFQPNPRGSSGRGRKFAEQVVGDMGGGDARDILAGIDALIADGTADPDRIGITGGSYGGFMACWLPTRDQRFAASVAMSPVTDWYSQHFNSNIGHWDSDFLRDRPEHPGGAYHERSPVLFADRVRTPTLLTAGANDRCTPPGQAIEFYRALRWRGVPSEVVIYPGEGHGVRKLPGAVDVTTRMVGWFERFMPPDG